MRVIKITPQGYCYGVVKAISIAKKAVETEQKPIYVLGDIVHNKYVSDYLKSLDITTIEDKSSSRLELLDKIENGTVIFTAHGVSPQVRKKAREKGLNMIDATCPEVMKTQEQIEKYLEMKYTIIFIGKKNHPEAEACVDIDSSNTIFISSEDDIKSYQYNKSKYFIAYQSTLNTDDLKGISNKLKTLLSDKIVVDNHGVCDATKSRQEAVKNLEGIDFLVVVGDENSNNSNKLVEITNVPAKRIISISELNLEDFKDINTVAITSGASTPTTLTKHISTFFEQFEYNDKSTWHYDEFSVEKMWQNEKI